MLDHSVEDCFIRNSSVQKSKFLGGRAALAQNITWPRCHGAQQQGMVGPSLVDAFKTLDKTEFHRTVFGGRVDKGMPDFSSSQMMQKNWENLYAYLKGRSDGQIKPGDLQAIDSK